MKAPGGFIESCTSTVVRPRPSMTLPARGVFQFPPPWNTRGIRVTNVKQEVGRDVLWDVYSYWPRINFHAGRETLRVFLCLDRNRGGPGPVTYEVDKRLGAVEGPTPVFPPTDHPLSWATGEQWYWSRVNPDILYCSDLGRLYRRRIGSNEMNAVADVGSLVAQLGDMLPPGEKVLWQWHTAYDDKTHSCSVKIRTDDGPWPLVGSAVYREDAAAHWTYFPEIGTLDECQISKDSRYLLIKDNIDSIDGEDNVIQDLRDGSTRTILDKQGAAGHSDNGYGYMVAADNHYPSLANAWRLWMFEESSQPQGLVVYHSPSWDAELKHVSHVNARNELPTRQYVVGSGASKILGPRANEIVGFRLDGSLECVVIAPVLTDMNAPGGGNEYAKLPKGNLDFGGEWFCWTSNAGGAFLDAFLVQVPTPLLVGSTPVPVCTHSCPVHCG